MITEEQIDAMYAAEIEAYALDDAADHKLLLECLEAAGWTLVRAGEGDRWAAATRPCPCGGGGKDE